MNWALENDGFFFQLKGHVLVSKSMLDFGGACHMMSGKKSGRPFAIFVLELLHIYIEFSEGLVPGMAIRQTQCIQHRRGPA